MTDRGKKSWGAALPPWPLCINAYCLFFMQVRAIHKIEGEWSEGISLGEYIYTHENFHRFMQS